MNLFLTPEQLQELTGYMKPALQARWLTRNGIPFYVNALGRVVVKASALDKTPVSSYAIGAVR